MIADKIKLLREARSLTQAEVARKLGVTRSGVNAWEMGITVPSTQCVVAIAELFNVSSDYLLGIEKTATLNVEGLSERQVAALSELISTMKPNDSQE
ncbi:MAG: helix-turn-helix transcriptional regulator [Clostridia bacterium]|nr:helix-turn-helix transcriptional regulator [Clostridia bacterium]